MSWRVYQSVLRSDVFATMTSRRIPSTSCAYQRGKVSLSPTVTSTPYGSTELSRSAAKSAVSRCPAREAQCQFAKSGTTAMSNTGDVVRQAFVVGTDSTSRPSFTVSVPTRDATDSQTYISPSAAQTPQAEKLQRKK